MLLHTSHACVCNCSRFCPTNMGISTNSILCQLALFKIVNGLFMLVPVALVMVVLSLSCVQFLGPPWAVALQASLSMGFPQESWSDGHFLLQGSSLPRDQTQVSCTAGILYHWATWETLHWTHSWQERTSILTRCWCETKPPGYNVTCSMAGRIFYRLGSSFACFQPCLSSVL